MWSKLKEIFSNFASIVITIILLIAIITAGILIARKNNEDKKSETSNPEVAQIFEPSISTPLPADVNQETTTDNNTAAVSENSGEVAGETTTEPSQSVTNYVAPKSGIDPNAPIAYQNDTYGLSITVAAHTNISEHNNLITFGTLFSVNVVDSKETLDQISAELSYSPDAKDIQAANLSGKQALKFNLNGKTAYVVLKNNKVLYLIGQEKFITQVKL
jgi:cytoskeletal protein RodZ